MANYVRVATISAAPLSHHPVLHGRAAVDHAIDHWRAKLDQVLPDEPDLIVLPETCDTYVAHSPDERRAYYEERGDRILDFFSEAAATSNSYIAYPTVRKVADGTYRNSILLLDRLGGVCGTYDKNYVVVDETEDYGILCGTSGSVVSCDFGEVALAICFDLNFDSLRAQYAAAKPDLILFSSMYHGSFLQSYWAYTCRAHFIGAVAGLTGTVLSPLGTVIAETTNYFDHVGATINTDSILVHLDFNWEKLRALKLKYGPDVSIQDPGHLGAVLVSSERLDLPVGSLIEEFEIETLDDYMKRSSEHRRHALPKEHAYG